MKKEHQAKHRLHCWACGGFHSMRKALPGFQGGNGGFCSNVHNLCESSWDVICASLHASEFRSLSI